MHPPRASGSWKRNRGARSSRALRSWSGRTPRCRDCWREIDPAPLAPGNAQPARAGDDAAPSTCRARATRDYRRTTRANPLPLPARSRARGAGQAASFSIGSGAGEPSTLVRAGAGLSRRIGASRRSNLNVSGNVAAGVEFGRPSAVRRSSISGVPILIKVSAQEGEIGLLLHRRPYAMRSYHCATGEPGEPAWVSVKWDRFAVQPNRQIVRGSRSQVFHRGAE